MDLYVRTQMVTPSLDLLPRRARWLRSRSGLLVLGMVAALSTIAACAIWDVRHRHAESLEDFGHHQQLLAQGLASDLEARLYAARLRPGTDPAQALSGLRRLEQPGVWVALVWPPGQSGFLTTDGKAVAPGLLGDAVQAGRGFLRLPRESSALLGLPRRAAVAGLARLYDSDGKVWWVAAVTSVRRARDQEREATWRTLLAVLVAAGAVLALGGVALHWQRQELRTQHALAVEEDRRKRELELARASRAATLGTLAMGITHELSTPLGIIAGRAEQLLGRLGSDERSRRSAQVIQEQAVRMGQIIRGLLGLVRDQSLGTDRFSPHAVCAEATALVAHRFAETGAELSTELPADARCPVLRGDQRLVEQALVNLLLNACDACAAGTVGTVGTTGTTGTSRPRVELRVRLEDQEVWFSVIDNGTGISAEAARRATEPFFTTKPVGKGSGLGLAVTQEIVKSHRGMLRIGPRREGGTCAEIALPQAVEKESHGDFS